MVSMDDDAWGLRNPELAKVLLPMERSANIILGSRCELKQMSGSRGIVSSSLTTEARVRSYVRMPKSATALDALQVTDLPNKKQGPETRDNGNPCYIEDMTLQHGCRFGRSVLDS